MLPCLSVRYLLHGDRNSCVELLFNAFTISLTWVFVFFLLDEYIFVCGFLCVGDNNVWGMFLKLQIFEEPKSLNIFKCYDLSFNLFT